MHIPRLPTSSTLEAAPHPMYRSTCMRPHLTPEGILRVYTRSAVADTTVHAGRGALPSYHPSVPQRRAPYTLR